METKQIFFFGLPILFGLLLFVFTFKYEQGKNIFKEYLMVLGYTFVSLVVIVCIDVFIFKTSINDILTGNMLYMHFIAYTISYAIIVAVLLSAVSDAIFTLIQPLTNKIKEIKQNAKFRTPKIK